MTIRTLMATAFITTVLHHTLNQKRQFSFLVIAWSKKINGFYLTKNLCQQWNIKAISHTNTVDPAKYLNQSQLPLNKYGSIEFAKTSKISYTSLIDEILIIVGVFINMKQVSLLLLGMNENLNENGSEESIPFSEYHNNDDANLII